MSNHDLVFYERRSTPLVLSAGASAPKSPPAGWGKQTRRRPATAQEERQIARGDWVRVDQSGNKPSSGDYKKTRYRPALVKGK